MPERFILAVDQGTTNTKAVLVDRQGRVIARASRSVPIRFPQPGWVEQDAEELWLSVVETIEECLEQAPPGSAPAAIGISNQRESVVLWERRTGIPVGPCVTWQCRRSAPICEELRSRALDSLVRERTGLALDPLFSAGKIRWLLDNVWEGQRRAEAGELCAGTVDSWLLWKLTGGAAHACDASNGSRTQLLDVRSGVWDEQLLELFGVPRALLPEVLPSSGVAGESVKLGRLPAGVPVGALIGDSHAALFGHAAFGPGAVKATYGTGTSLMTLTERPVFSAGGLSTTIAWRIGTVVAHALEGNILVTGSAVQWLGEFLGLADPAHDVAGLAERAEPAEGLYVVPAFVGLGAPHWDAQARGLICGLTRGTTAAQVARATLEAIAYQVRDVFEVMEMEAGQSLPELMTDGGASRNDSLMQFQADVLGRPVVRNLSTDLSAVGAAWLAGLAVGFWRSLEELEALPRQEDRFEPRMSESERIRRIEGWREAVARARLHLPRGAQVSGGQPRT
ncbi:MAG: glycerol kinase GlpK [Bryobacterales bacterium]|nr:glycerol kinase GlpK [Bryobacteraceae bacterium]MDW8129016.1 glycerol kinase GlpK [Bryobacterales bacterium]